MDGNLRATHQYWHLRTKPTHATSLYLSGTAYPYPIRRSSITSNICRKQPLRSSSAFDTTSINWFDLDSGSHGHLNLVQLKLYGLYSHSHQFSSDMLEMCYVQLCADIPCKSLELDYIEVQFFFLLYPWG